LVIIQPVYHLSLDSDHYPIKKVSSRIDELGNLQQILEKPLSIVTLAGVAILYPSMFSVVIFGLANATFGLNDPVVFFSSLGITIVVTFLVVRKVYLDRKQKTKESITNTKNEIQKLKVELQSLTKRLNAKITNG
jgi:hypothetical protein